MENTKKYQYKNYTIQDEGVWYVYTPAGKKCGPFTTDKEAEEFVDIKVDKRKSK